MFTSTNARVLLGEHMNATLPTYLPRDNLSLFSRVDSFRGLCRCRLANGHGQGSRQRDFLRFDGEGLLFGSVSDLVLRITFQYLQCNILCVYT